MLSRGTRRSSLWESIIPQNEPVKLNTILTGEANIVTHRKLCEGEKEMSGVVTIKIKYIRLDTVALLMEENVANQHIFCTLQIMASRAHPFNLVNINVYAYHSGRTETKIGNIPFHLHDIISGSPAEGEYPIIGTHLNIGQIQLEVTFNYGSFGYGISSQLIEEDITNEEMIQYSLFPRINPPDSHCEPGNIILRSQAVVHPNCVPFQKRVYLSHSRDLEGQLEEMYTTTPVREQLMKSRSNIEAIRNKYYEISDRSSRLHFLHHILQEKSDRTESVPEEPVEIEETFFPAKEYIKFLTPSVDDHDED